MDKEKIANEILGHRNNLLNLYGRREELEKKIESLTQEVKNLNDEITAERGIANTLEYILNTDGMAKTPPVPEHMKPLKE